MPIYKKQLYRAPLMNLNDKSILPPSLLEKSTITPYKDGDIVFNVNDSIKHMIYVLEGEVHGVRNQMDGTNAILMRGVSGEYFAAASIMLDSYPCIARAIGNTKLLQIPMLSFRERLEDDTVFSHSFTQSLCITLKQQCARSERYRLKTAKDRIMHYLTCEAFNKSEITLPFTITTWANELGLEPESLYRTLSEMEKEGIIERNRRLIKIKS